MKVSPDQMTGILIRGIFGHKSQGEGHEVTDTMRQRLEDAVPSEGCWHHQRLDEARKDSPLETSEEAWSH